MSDPVSDPDNSDPVELPPSYKRLRALVIGLGIVLIVGFAVVFGTIIYRTVNMLQSEPVDVATIDEDSIQIGGVTIARPIGATLSDVEVEGDDMIFHFTGADGDTIIIFDMAEGVERGRVHIP